MVNAFNKKQSKRMTCSKKYKIRRKVKEHNKRLAKSLKDSVNKKKKIAGRVPNMAPFKEELLQEAIRQEEERTEEKKTKKKVKQPQIVTKKSDEKTVSAPPKKSVSVHVVLSQCEVLVWVVDIRSVNECLCQTVKEEIQQASKDVVFVLNKIDLVPFDIVRKWYSVLSEVAPTFLFKSTEIILTECEQIIPALKQVLAKHCGSKHLVNYLQQKYTDKITRVGVIGVAKVGKSCVVSTILRGCGRTKAKKSADTKLNDKLRLSTTPGLIESKKTGMLHVIDNMTKYMNYAPDIITALSAHVTKEQAMFQFTLPDYKHPEGLLDALAIRYNMFSGKAPDHAAASRLILKQIRDNKLKFYVDTNCDKLEEIPDSVMSDVEKFVYSGDALRLTNTNLNITITKPIKSKGFEMDTEEGLSDIESGDEESQDEEELLDGSEEDESDEEMA